MVSPLEVWMGLVRINAWWCDRFDQQEIRRTERMTCRINLWFEQRRTRSSIHKCISLHSQFVYLTFINRSDIGALHFWSSNCSTTDLNKHLLRSLFNQLRMFVELDLTQIYGKVTIKQDQSDHCTERYNEATMNRSSMIKRSRFCCQTVNSKI